MFFLFFVFLICAVCFFLGWEPRVLQGRVCLGDVCGLCVLGPGVPGVGVLRAGCPSLVCFPPVSSTFWPFLGIISLSRGGSQQGPPPSSSLRQKNAEFCLLGSRCATLAAKGRQVGTTWSQRGKTRHFGWSGAFGRHSRSTDHGKRPTSGMFAPGPCVL